MNKIENPIAFPFQPLTLQGEPTFPEYGMTMRDWFAGQALAGITAALSAGYVPDDAECTEAASVAFRISDAMLAARQGGGA